MEVILEVGIVSADTSTDILRDLLRKRNHKFHQFKKKPSYFQYLLPDGTLQSTKEDVRFH